MKTADEMFEELGYKKEEEKKAIEDSRCLINELSNHKDKDFIGRLYYKNKPIEENLEKLLNLIKKLQEENEQLKNAIAVANKLEERIKENFVPKEKIENIIEEINVYKKIAKESIGQSIVIADSDSLEYGRMQAHSADMSMLQKLLESEGNKYE